MRKTFIALILCLLCTNYVFAHAGTHLPFKSIFKKQYKYKINTADSHIGHFYVKKSRVNRASNETLRVEHTIHLEENVVKKLNVKFKDKTSLLSYKFDMEDYTYFFNFYIADGDFLSGSSPGSMVILDKLNASFSVENVTLDPFDDSVTEQASGHGH